MTRGVVIKSTGKYYHIKSLDTQDLVIATIRGKFRLQGFRLTNPVAVGDIVEYQVLKDSSATIQNILPRRNYVIRQSPRRKHFLHLLASNIDQALLVVTIVEPNLKQGFIDRFLLMTEPFDIPVTILFNKKDLYNETDLEQYHTLASCYQQIGYDTLLSSALTSEGLSKIRYFLKEKTTLISGQSGVGKSSLINALEPNLQITTKVLSDYSGKGQHTTTFAQMHELTFGGSIIDTPGIKTLSYNHLEVMDVAHNFREFFQYSSSCKYNNCTHRNEPNCAIKQALQNGEICELRYANYLQILQDVENQNHWERIKDY